MGLASEAQQFVETNSVYGAAVDPVSGNLTNLPPFPSGRLVQVETSQGKFMIEVMDLNGSIVSSYPIDTSSGTLATLPVATVTFDEIPSQTSYPQMVIVTPSK
jgi:hypothetical protein